MQRFSRRVMLGVGAVAATATYGVAWEPHWLDVRLHRVIVQRLPRALSGFRVAQITDAHLSNVGVAEQELVAAVKAINAQVVLLTGDIVDGVESLALLRTLCAELVGPGRTVLGTFGNWERWGGISPEALGAAYANTGARLLVNDSVDVDGVEVFGTDDGLAGRPRMATSAPAGPRILASHSPGILQRAAGPRSDLVVAGHTHGGQARVGAYAPVLPPGSGRFVAGWYETDVGKLYVSRGTGTSVLPARFCCRPELPVFELVRAG